MLLLKRLKRIFKNYSFVIKKVWEFAPFYLILLSIIAIIGAFLPIIPLFLTKELLNLVVTGNTDDIQYILLLVILMALVNYFSNYTNYIRTYISNKTVGILEKHINLSIIEKACNTELKYVDSSEYYVKLDNARRAVGRRWDMLVLAPINAFAHLATLISLISILSSYNIWLVLILLIGVIPNSILQIKVRENLQKFYMSQVPENRKISYIENLLCGRYFSKESRLFQYSQYYLDKLKNLLNVRLTKLNKIRRTELNINGFSSLLSYIAVLVCDIYLVINCIMRKISIGDWQLYTSTLGSITFNLNTLLNIIANSYEEELLADVLNDYIINVPIGNNTSGNSLSNLPDVIEFRNCSFKYPNSDKYVIKDLNLTIKKGQKIALVGLNGAGKSTFIKLLCGLYEVTGGKILYDGEDIKNYKKNDILNKFSIVFQDFSRYAFTIKENIAISHIEDLNNDELINDAACKSNILEDIEKLNKSFDTYITKDYSSEGTGDLSGGQWQKIAIARSFFRNAPFVIFDEPTSNLDPIGETEVYKKLFELSTGKTTLIISHRLSSCTLADRILFMRDGKIIEDGNHEQLMKYKKEYYKLFTLQAKPYNSSK